MWKTVYIELKVVLVKVSLVYSSWERDWYSGVFFAGMLSKVKGQGQDLAGGEVGTVWQLLRGVSQACWEVSQIETEGLGPGDWSLDMGFL